MLAKRSRLPHFAKLICRQSSTIGQRVQKALDQRNLPEAEKIAKEVIQLDKQSDEYIDQTVQISKLLTPFKPNFIHDLLKKAIEIDKQNPDLEYQVGMVHIRKQELKEAETQMNKVLSMDPEHCPALCGLGTIYTRLKEPEKAEEILEKALKIAETNQSTILEGSVFLQFISLYSSPKYIEKYKTKKLDQLVDKLMFDVKYSQIHQSLYVVLYQGLYKKDPEKYVKKQQRIESILNCNLLFKSSLKLSSEKKFSQTIEILDQAISEISKIKGIPSCVPLFSQIFYRKAISLISNFSETGNVAAAGRKSLLNSVLKEYSTSISFDDSNALAWVGKGEILFELDEFNDSIDCFNNALKHGHQNFVHVYFRLAILYRKINELQKSIEYCQRVLQINPNHKEARLELFACQMQKDEETNNNNNAQQQPSYETIKISEEILQTDDSFKDFYEKNKHRDPQDMLEEMKSFVDNNFKPKTDDEEKVYEYREAEDVEEYKEIVKE